MPTGIELIAQERQRQIEKEGWTPGHDAQHTDNSLAKAAACYALPNEIEVNIKYMAGSLREPIQKSKDIHAYIKWPWAEKWDKRKQHDRIKQLSIAGALIAAEIDRINSLKMPVQPINGSPKPQPPCSVDISTKGSK